jgi:two-component system nitrogen regulation sensor histidine kinase GlnL
MIADPKRLAEILDSARAGIVAVDGRGRIELQNAEASRILGLSASAVAERAVEECYGPDHPLSALLRAVLETGREVALNAVQIPSRLGGEPMVADLAAAPVALSDPRAGAVVALYDRTITQELQQHVDQATRSEVFARLAAGIAHELRNPLGGIRGAAELLDERLEPGPLHRFPELIRAEVDRMRRLLDDLAQLTRGEDLSIAPTNLHRVLDDLLELHAQGPGWERIELRREYDPSIPDLPLDPDRIAQVLLNLIRNAVQAMPEGGALVIRTRVEASYHLAEGRRAVHIVRVDVEDTGPGIPEEDLPHVFTPFFTRRRWGGTGLGLAIAQHWTVRMGGRIQLTSRVGAGTRVRLLLPLRRPR